MKSRILSCAMLLTISLGGLSLAHAGSATWDLNPTSNDWSTAANWTPETVPNGPTDTATFSLSNVTDPFVNMDIEVAATIFDVGASAYEISLEGLHTFTLSGTGVMNNSGQVQTFVLNPEYHLRFTNSATAGSQTNIQGGTVEFDDTSSAGSSTFTIVQGEIQFRDHSSAADGIFMVGGLDQPPGTFAQIFFFEHSSAGNGYFVVNSSSSPDLENHGFVVLDENAIADSPTFINMPSSFVGGVGGLTNIIGSAGNGTFVAAGSSVQGFFAAGEVGIFGRAGSGSYTATGGTNGGSGGVLFFSGSANGQTARLTVLGNAIMEMGTTDAPGLTIGSLEGDGLVYITKFVGFGEKRLTVGTNNLDTTFSGVIHDSADPGAAGFLAKVGTGTLTLSGANTYHGGTIIREGTLLVTTPNGSGTGSGPVHVEGGTLGGTGMITGPLRVGIGTGTAFLSPGVDGTGTLSVRAGVTFAADGVYQCELSSDEAEADDVNVKEVTIQSGATFTFVPLGTSTLPIGMIFTVLEKRDPGVINGSFQNLADGAIFTAGGNTFQASYSGGDGNDLTLTVVP